MKVLLTGATGYIGSVVAERLLAAGHEVIGLARSDEAARKLEASGVRPLRGDLQDSEVLTRAARVADGVIHTASTGDANAPQADAQAVAVILDALEGTSKPFIYTSGVWVMGNTNDRVADEETPLDPTPLVAWRPAIEQRVLAASERGVRSIVLRPAMVYGRGGGSVGEMIQSGRQKGVVRFVGTGENRWSLIHVEDLADLYVKALEKAPPATLLMVAAGPSMTVLEIAEAAARAADVDGHIESWPIEQARERLGPYADALVLDQQVSAEKAMRLLDWTPRAPSLLEELSQGSATS
ncbi:MAG TPA: SDR family oxidoreductase [Pyrinomonadaceae bacterium]|jgi:nucleoside-diphosphate-sugar epimerase